MLDAKEGSNQARQGLAGHVLESGKALSILVNKWDLALESFRKRILFLVMRMKQIFGKNYLKSVRKELFFLPESIAFVSRDPVMQWKNFRVARDLDARMENFQLLL